MTFKRILTLALAGMITASFAQAKKMSDLKIYINPGHGGYTSNDRPIHLYPFVANDSAGYWESKSNLYKGLHMYHILDSLGAKPYLSRIKNTEADDRSLSGIAAEANQLGVDLFFSIHSNAGENVNYPLMLYRENTIGTPRYPENITLSKILWKNLHSNKLAVWTRNTEYVAGDLTFYQNMWQGGLGVLRTLYVVGLLSEGGMHEHRPEAYRLMNDDYWWLEAWHFVRSIMEYYDTEDKFVNGNVAGVVYDDHNLREKDMPVSFSRHGRDQLAPVNFAYVELLDKNGNLVQKRTTDNMYNGVYVFRNVSPGDYKVRISHNEYYSTEQEVTVVANEVSYLESPLNMKREFPLEITGYSPAPVDGEPVSCATPIEFTFNTDVDTKSLESAFSISPEVDGYWEYSETYHKAKFIPTLSLALNTTYTVKISQDAKTPDTHFSNPNLKEPFELTFTTKGRNRMELIDQFPADGGQVHYVTPSIEFRFDAKIDAANLYDVISITDSKGKAVSVNKRTTKYNQLSNGYGNAVIAVSGNLNVGEKYTVMLSSDLRDAENLPLTGNVNFEFTANDAAEGSGEGAEVVYNFEDACDFAYDEDNSTGITNIKPTAIRSTSDKFFDKAAGKFGYTLTENHGCEVVWNYTGEPIQFNTGDIVGMYIKGDFNNHELWVGVSSGTNKKYTKLCDLDFLGWQYKETQLNNLEADFCPFLLSDIKLVQKTSPITQKGQYCLDNIIRKVSQGVGTVTADEATGVSVAGIDGYVAVSGASVNSVVKVIAVDGRVVAAARGNVTLPVAPGLYVVTVDNLSFKVTVK